MKLNNKGLTHIELMVAMAISLVAFGLIYQAYAAQERARTREQLVVEMQQNARSALALMRRELRMSGYDPRGLPGALLLAAVVLPASRLAGTARENINWTHGLGGRPSTRPAVVYVPLLWVGFALVVFLPTHLLLLRFGS